MWFDDFIEMNCAKPFRRAIMGPWSNRPETMNDDDDVMCRTIEINISDKYSHKTESSLFYYFLSTVENAPIRLA